MEKGTVFLVGAGPGDPGLITVKALRLVQEADVIVYDRLVDRRILQRAGDRAELIDVGKAPGERRTRQDQINSLLVTKAKEGFMVVRLKGGDPFVFGRGAEEAEALVAQGIPFEIVPGVSSAIAAPAYAGIPLTHRGFASFFTVVTGSEAPDKPEHTVPWEKLAEAGGTLVVLMGWESLGRIVESLLRHGRSPDTPVALVQWGTEPYQRTVTGSLSSIVATAVEAGLAPPVVAVIGEVARLREELRWFDRRPLFGKRILVTRSRSQASNLAELLARRGADPIELPTIEIVPLDDYSELDSALRKIGHYDWVAFTSANAVQIVFDRLLAMGLDSRSLSGARVAAIGPATAASLRRWGIVADFVPDTFVSESIVEGMATRGVDGARVLLPRSSAGRQALGEGLAALGASVHQVTAYRTSAPRDSRERASDILAGGIDVVTFTSSSTVSNLAGLLHGDLDLLSRATIACIGPITAAKARELGLNVDIVAREHTVTGLVDALVAHYAEEDVFDG